MDYNCNRCGYITTRKDHLKKHLERKKLCKATLQDIDPEIQLNEICTPKLNEVTFNCKHCDRPFNISNNMYRHQKTCKYKKNNDRITILENLVIELSKQMVPVVSKHMVPSTSAIIPSIPVATASVINNNNTTNNININVTLNAYHNGNPAKYDTSTVDFNNIFNKIVGDTTNGIISFLKMKYFNPDHPENHIIRINDKKLIDSGNVYIHNGTTWELESSDKVYNELNDEAANSLLDNMNSGISIARKHIPVDDFGGVYNGLWKRDVNKPKDEVIDKLNDLLVNNINDTIKN